jgi:hypothetical protein
MDPVADNEVLMRRISAVHFDRSIDPNPSPEAFRIRAGEQGLSLYRRKYHLPAEIGPIASTNPSPYYVAMFLAKTLRDAGLTLLPRPTPNHVGHVEIPEMNYADRKTPRVEEWKLAMAERLAFEIVDPIERRPVSLGDP